MDFQNPFRPPVEKNPPKIPTGGRKSKNDFFSKIQKNIFFFKRYDKMDFTNDFFRLSATFTYKGSHE